MKNGAFPWPQKPKEKKKAKREPEPEISRIPNQVPITRDTTSCSDSLDRRRGDTNWRKTPRRQEDPGIDKDECLSTILSQINTPTSSQDILFDIEVQHSTERHEHQQKRDRIAQELMEMRQNFMGNQGLVQANKDKNPKKQPVEPKKKTPITEFFTTSAPK